MTIEIVQITPENYFPAFRIQWRCHFNPWSEKVFQDCLTRPYFAYQLRQEDKVCGYYVGMDVAGEATLMDIGVDITTRGQGLGNSLLQHFINMCQQKACEDIWLEVRSSNESAIYLYQKYGFEVIEIRKDYYPSEQGREDALMMKKVL